MNKTIFLAVMLFAFLGLSSGTSWGGPPMGTVKPKPIPNFMFTCSLAFNNVPSGSITVGDNVTLTWVKDECNEGHAIEVDLYWSNDGGDSWTKEVERFTQTSYSWPVPEEAVGNEVMLKIVDSNYPMTRTISDPFIVEEE